MSKIPSHIAIIMDGNRRWARSHHLPELMGHKRVADDILEPLVEHAADKGIRYLTFWAWSTENWKRKPEEVNGVMNIFRHVIKKRWKRLAEKGVKIMLIGDISKFPKDIESSLKKVVEDTKNNKRIVTVFALNYGGRDEIIRAIKALKVSHGSKESKRQGITNDTLDTFDTLTPDGFSQLLDTKDIPDPELIIRTGGEQRLSGFFLWQSQYSELYFPSFYMPDFTPDKLDEAIGEYRKRKRRFGV